MKLKCFAIVMMLSSCAFVDDPQYAADPMVDAYVKKFFEEASKHGMDIPIPNSLAVGLVHGLESEEHAWAQAERGTTDVHLIYLDYDIINEWTLKNDTLSIERLVFHELGHSILHRRHTDTYSIMNDVDYFDDYVRFADRREKLLNELFNN